MDGVKEEKQQELTLGQKRIRVSFNASKDDFVGQIKSEYAKLFDLINAGLSVNPEFTDFEAGEFKRLKSLALTSLEESAMWAVKTATS